MDSTAFKIMYLKFKIEHFQGYGKFVPLVMDTGHVFVTRETDLTHTSIQDLYGGIPATFVNMRALIHHFSRTVGFGSTINQWIVSMQDMEDEVELTSKFPIWMCDVLNAKIPEYKLDDILYCAIGQLDGKVVITPSDTRRFSPLDLLGQFERFIVKTGNVVYEYNMVGSTFIIQRGDVLKLSMRFTNETIQVGAELNGKFSTEKLPIRFNYNDWRPQRWENYMNHFNDLDIAKYDAMVFNNRVYDIADSLKKDVIG